MHLPVLSDQVSQRSLTPHALVIDTDFPEEAFPLRHQRVVYSHSLRLQLIDWLVVLALTVDQVGPQIALSTVPSNLFQV